MRDDTHTHIAACRHADAETFRLFGTDSISDYTVQWPRWLSFYDEYLARHYGPAPLATPVRPQGRKGDDMKPTKNQFLSDAVYGDPSHYACDGQREESCAHIAIVSISETECQCMDCLRKWPKEPGFRSDWPEFDRG